MRQTRLIATLGVVAALLMAPVTAKALSFTVDASHEVVQGGSVGFNATLTLEAGDPDPLYLIGIDVTPNATGLTADDSPFYSPWPEKLDSSAPGVSDTFSGLLFTVFADFTALPPGPYVGSVQLLVASDPDVDSSYFSTGWQDFEVTVLPGTVPEPVTMGLLGLGFVGLAMRRKMAR